ncbi:hypothetical protein V0M98_21970 [Pseudomonas silesiensis]
MTGDTAARRRRAVTGLMAGVVDRDGFAADIGVVRLALGNDQILRHISPPVSGSRIDQAMDALAWKYIHPAGAATVSKITGPANAS